VARESQGPEAVGAHGRLRHVPGHREGPGILARDRKGSSLTAEPSGGKLPAASARIIREDAVFAHNRLREPRLPRGCALAGFDAVPTPLAQG
jgi:hypothetical protein